MGNRSYLKYIKKYRYLLLTNLFLFSFFVWIALYIKLAALTDSPDREQRFQILVALFQDPFTRARPYVGLLTSISEILWCVIATICLVTVVTLWQLRCAHRCGSRFLRAAGIFISVLLLDEVLRVTLLLHALVGIPKAVLYLIYIGGAVAIAIRFGRYVLSATPYFLLMVTIALFLVSGITDALPLTGRGSLILLEDGTKLLGLTNLLVYFWQVSQANLSAAISPAIADSQRS
ncbi:MAG: hypothetical protein AAFY78_10730 [Cyanobacteria bacterium J06648_16]